ncbi:A-kinase anchor protein 17A, partial [Stegodyphus mimosarum]
MKPGERPDTVYLQELPVRWFAETGKPMKPSERLLQKAFATYGRIRRLEIPANHETEERTFGKTSSLHRDLLFEAYIQYEEYVEFAMAMDSLRGKKLLYKDADGKVYSADIKVDFDRTNYLSERCIKKREAEAKKANTVCVSQLPNVAENVSLANVQNVQYPIESSKIQKEDIQQNLVEQKEVENEAKLLLKELLHRAEVTERKKEMEKKMKLEKSALKQLEIKTQKKEEIKLKEEKKTREKLIQKEIILKEKLLRNLKAKEEEKIIETREKLRKELAGRRVLKSVLAN